MHSLMQMPVFKRLMSGRGGCEEKVTEEKWNWKFVCILFWKAMCIS